MGRTHSEYLKSPRTFQEDLRRKNKIRDKFKKIRGSSITPAQWTLFHSLESLGKEYQFKIVKEREIYTKEGVRFADLFIQKYGLIIEVDGGYHSTLEQREKDLQRDKEIWKKKKIITLRFSNESVWSKKQEILRTIRIVVSQLSLLSHYKTPGKGKKKLHNTLARRKIYNEIRKTRLISA